LAKVIRKDAWAKIVFQRKDRGWLRLSYCKINRKGDKFVIDMIGAATIANPKGAVEAIKARLSELQERFLLFTPL
jgi:hypothetical protein